MSGILGIVDLAIGAIGDAIKRHSAAGAQEQAQIEADMLASIKTMRANFVAKDDAHDKRWAELGAEIAAKIAADAG